MEFCQKNFCSGKELMSSAETCGAKTGLNCFRRLSLSHPLSLTLSLSPSLSLTLSLSPSLMLCLLCLIHLQMKKEREEAATEVQQISFSE